MSTAKDASAGIEQADDLSATTERRPATPSCSGTRSAPTIELRLARATETDVVRRLAQLDSAPELTGQIVIALVNGDAVASLSLLDQRVVANRFVPTREAVALLRLRAKHLSAPTRRKIPKLPARLTRLPTPGPRPPSASRQPPDATPEPL